MKQTNIVLIYNVYYYGLTTNITFTKCMRSFNLFIIDTCRSHNNSVSVSCYQISKNVEVNYSHILCTLFNIFAVNNNYCILKNKLDFLILSK